jgi:dipicolinate synthase subunit B
MTDTVIGPGALKDKSIGWGITGVYEALEAVLPHVKQAVAAGARVRPVFSTALSTTTTRYGKPAEWAARFAEATGNRVLDSILAIEPLGPRREFDVFVVAPCSGATMARIACAITDDPVAFAAKGHLRNSRPVVLGISTNDALGLNARNLGILLGSRLVYFVPFRQDNPGAKPTSVTADWGLVLPAVAAALEGRQLQPLLLGPGSGGAAG